MFGVKVAQALASAWPDEDISCGSRDEPDRVTNRRLAIGASPATIAHRALMIMFRQSRCGVDGRSPSALLRGSHSDPFAIAKPHVIAVVALSDLKLNSRLVTYLRRCEQEGVEESVGSVRSSDTQQYLPWPIERRLSETDIQTIISDFMTGTPKHVLAARYPVSLSGLKSLLRRRGVRRPRPGSPP